MNFTSKPTSASAGLVGVPQIVRRSASGKRQNASRLGAFAKCDHMFAIAHVWFDAGRERVRIGAEFFHCGRGANMSQPMDDSAA
jgi:hypothetical protein